MRRLSVVPVLLSVAALWMAPAVYGSEKNEDQDKKAKVTKKAPAKKKVADGDKGKKREARPDEDKLSKLEEAGRRIKHLRLAAEHLQEAGAKDLANQLREKAEAMEHEARAAKMEKTSKVPLKKKGEKGDFQPQMEKLHREVAELREELKEIAQHVKKLERSKK